MGDVVDVRSGKDYKHLSEGNIPVYGTGGFMLNVNQALSYDEDAIGIGRKGTIDKPYILKAPFWTVDTLFYAIPREKVDLNFAFDVFQNIDWKKKDESTGVPSLSKTAINEIDVLVPQYDEQQPLGQFFNRIDNLITLHQCKCQIDGCRFQSPLAITWEQRKLGEIGSVSMCRRIFKEQTSENGEIPFYKIGTFGGEADAFISRELFEEYKAKYQYPKKGDILISASGSIGRTVVFTGKNEYFQDSNIVWLNHDKHLDNSFLKCFYSIVKWAGIEGSTIKRLYNDNILNTAITLPSVEEQQKIGAYFENLDNLITLHQRKYDKLTNVKKSMLEKMFPQNGSNVPEIRFKGFTEAWEQRKVREVTDRYDNLRIPVAASLRVAGTTPYYGANGIQDYVDGYTHDGEFILVAEDGANDLKNYPVKCVKGRIWVNNHAHVLQGKYDCADNQFLAYAISQADIESLLVGGGRAKLNAETLMGIDLLLPNKAEQIRIGKYLAQLDNLITLHQRELEKLKNLKKACLEKMFV